MSAIDCNQNNRCQPVQIKDARQEFQNLLAVLIGKERAQTLTPENFPLGQLLSQNTPRNPQTDSFLAYLSGLQKERTGYSFRELNRRFPEQIEALKKLDGAFAYLAGNDTEACATDSWDPTRCYQVGDARLKTQRSITILFSSPRLTTPPTTTTQLSDLLQLDSKDDIGAILSVLIFLGIESLASPQGQTNCTLHVASFGSNQPAQNYCGMYVTHNLPVFEKALYDQGLLRFLRNPHAAMNGTAATGPLTNSSRQNTFPPSVCQASLAKQATTPGTRTIIVDFGR